MFPAIYRHPLTAARASLGSSAPQYLKRLNRIHQELGFGVMACRPEKAPVGVERVVA